MTTLLSQAIQEVEKLSEDAQNQIAEWLLAEISRILSETEGKGERQIDHPNSTEITHFKQHFTMPQTLLIIGDVHGCFYTFRSLVEKYWQPGTMRLIQLGDLTDRGKYVPETIEFARQLEEEHPESVTFLKGNHEAMVLEYWDAMRDTIPPIAKLYSRQNSTMSQYYASPELLERLPDDMEWLRKRPLFWENDHVFVSHAGISHVWNSVEEALVPDHEENILWTRSRLKNIGKVQVIGHTPRETGEPEFREAENCWNIDTGAVFGLNLTALHLALDGTVLETFILPSRLVDYKFS